jgi:Domain of Unknown Function (DUF1080)
MQVTGNIEFAAALTFAVFLTSGARAETIDFETLGKAGSQPSSFSAATTGKGSPADWQLREVAGAPSGKTVVAQLSTKGANMRFPVLVYDPIQTSNVSLTVKFKAISGSEDQAAGLVVRFQDPNNYYVVRANALEDNVVFYIVKNGQRIDLPVKGKGRTYGATAPVTKKSWNTLGLTAQGNTFVISLNGKQLYEVEDKQIDKAGKVGLWTKADSVIEFDDFVIEPMK